MDAHKSAAEIFFTRNGSRVATAKGTEIGRGEAGVRGCSLLDAFRHVEGLFSGGVKRGGLWVRRVNCEELLKKSEERVCVLGTME